MFCSKACKGEAQSGSIELICPVCGKSFRRHPSRVKKVETSYCSIECRDIGRKVANTSCSGTSSGNLRDWMNRRGLMETCQRCGYDEHPEILVVHHGDRDRSNNDVGNLEVLCPNCHALEHYSTSSL
jgi:uncharacterized C2H2 Zn-finger protein